MPQKRFIVRRSPHYSAVTGQPASGNIDPIATTRIVAAAAGPQNFDPLHDSGHGSGANAYYLDYQQERGKFVKAVIENLANWQFVSKRLVESDQ